MPYTINPKEKHAKAYGSFRISTKDAEKLCRIIRGKKLSSAKRLLDGLLSEKRSLGGKYYTKAAGEIKMLIESCEKNAEFAGLDMGALFLHASAHTGTIMRRRRRKSSFGSQMKSTNVEVMLIEKGKKTPVKKKKIKEAAEKKIEEEINSMKKEERKIIKEEKELEKKAEEAMQ